MAQVATGWEPVKPAQEAVARVGRTLLSAAVDFQQNDKANTTVEGHGFSRAI
jgi:hypothetical protein